jgi:hypothetical protein
MPAVTMLCVLEGVQTQQDYIGTVIAALADVCALKVALVVEACALPVHHYSVAL